MKRFDHEKLDVFSLALDFVVMAERIASETQRGNGELRDQLRRAALSVVLNIAEGAGEYSSKEKARFYRVAKRSAHECAALVEVYRRLSLVDGDLGLEARSGLFRIVSMLVRLVRSAEGVARTEERRAPGREPPAVP